VALSKNVPFFQRQVNALPSSTYFTGLSMSLTRHGWEQCFVITLMRDAEPNSTRLSESRPLPTPPVRK
jgi:hypothetical protein